MTDQPAYGSLPFQEAIDFLRQKVNVPSAKYADMLEGAHARAFTVAGATKDGMLVDFRAAIDQAIASGTTLETFRKDFDDIVAKYGWDYNGGRNWRSRVIYETNMRTAYQAGRYSQMTDPDVLRYRPYWQYVHQDGEKYPRPEHEAWDGLVIDASDPWWSTHYPPNGWGCKCRVKPVSRRELAALGKSGPDTAPPIDAKPVIVNTSAGPVSIDTPKGVDPGWGYSVGEAAYGKPLSDQAMDAWRAAKADAWESMTPGNWESAGRPKEIPLDNFDGAIPPAATDKNELQSVIERAIGGKERAFQAPTGDPVLVNAQSLADHWPLDRASFAPLLPGLITDPFEIWASFERHKGTGRVVLRKRFLKFVRTQKNRGYMLVANAANGALEAYTLFRSRDVSYLQRERRGELVWARSVVE
jgi:hypothetical protein